MAKELGLDIFGTGAALVIAKNHEIIDSVTSPLQQLDEMGIYFSDKIKSQILKNAGE